MEYQIASIDLKTYNLDDLLILYKYYGVEISSTLELLAKQIIDDAKWKLRLSVMPNPDMDKFDEIIGGGGYGNVIKQSNSSNVGKFLHRPQDCNSSKIEFEKHLLVYNTFADAQSRTDLYPQICLSKPISFNSSGVRVLDIDYTCYYLMTLVNPWKHNSVYHIVNEDLPYNKLIGKIYSEPISDTNPSRGFFATYSYMDKELGDTPVEELGNLNTVKKLVRYIGYAFGVMFFGAVLYPLDVEYVIGRDSNGVLCFAVLDFGLSEYMIIENETDATDWAQKAIDNILDLDIYFPTEAEYIEICKQGITDAFNLYNDKEYMGIAYSYIMRNWR